MATSKTSGAKGATKPKPRATTAAKPKATTAAKAVVKKKATTRAKKASVAQKTRPGAAVSKAKAKASALQAPKAKARALRAPKAKAKGGAGETGGTGEAAWWTALEAAWKEVAPELKATRRKMAANRASEEDYEGVEGALEDVVTALQDAFEEMTAPALLAVDRALERVLYRLDRQDIQEVTDGSDDGFLYCRGFIAAVGQEYADAVDADPSVARVDREQGDVAYLPLHAYERRFGERPATRGISRESCSNPEGWPR